jgi:hypothetical protein
MWCEGVKYKENISFLCPPTLYNSQEISISFCYRFSVALSHSAISKLAKERREKALQAEVSHAGVESWNLASKVE